jgi:hypothetical protein
MRAVFFGQLGGQALQVRRLSTETMDHLDGRGCGAGGEAVGDDELLMRIEPGATWIN